MKNLIPFFICVILCPEISSAQDTLKMNCNISVTDFYVTLGFGPGDPPTSTLEDFHALAPGSKLLSGDLSAYEEQEFYQKTNGISGMAGFHTALSFADRKTGKTGKNLQLRIGFFYMSGRHFNYKLEHSESMRTDTLTSSQTGDVIYLDSVFRSTYDMKYSSDQLRLDVCMLYRFNPAARFSFYAGFGAAGGIVFNAMTQIEYKLKKSVESANPYADRIEVFSADESNFEREKIKNKSGTGYSVYVPIGVDLRLGRKKNGPGRVHFFWEALSALNSLTVPELGNTTRPTLFLTGGIRFTSVR